MMQLITIDIGRNGNKYVKTRKRLLVILVY
jgi:hypothetical protein